MNTSYRLTPRGVALAGLATLSTTGHVIYPVALGIATARRKATPPPAMVEWPGVTVLIPAYLEQRVIAAKVADVERQQYPGPLEILVLADDRATASAARRTGACVLHSGERLGKSAAVNRGVAAARHEIIVLTDANAQLDPHALTALVRHFADPAVGAVAGAKHVTDSAGQGLYWHFEAWLKRRESLLGTTMGVVGEVAAFRRSLFRPLPNQLVADDLWLALDVIESGFQVRFEPRARATEVGSPEIGVEWERRTRIITGTLDVLRRRRHLLVPRGGPLAGQLWGHKLLRSTVGPLAHTALLGWSLVALRHSNLARVAVAGHAVGLAGVAQVVRGGRVPKPMQLPTQVLFLQGVALGGLLRYLRGDRPAMWPKVERLHVVVPVAVPRVESGKASARAAS